MKNKCLKLSFLVGFLGAIQFFCLSTYAMYMYPGGTLHQPQLDYYAFFYNFFSDLGRTYTFDRQSNASCHLIFKTTLCISGLSTMVFFCAQTQLFRNKIAKNLSFFTCLLGVIAGLSYIGIGTTPWNIDYWGHRFYVRIGFLSFLGMAFFYALTIFIEPLYPPKYAWALLLFSLVLLTQILIMFLATNAWHSNEALFLQALAQKIVVYAQIICLIYQSLGALGYLRLLEKAG